MAKLPLSLALGDYEHTRDLLNGDVRPEGIEVTGLRVPIEELLFRLHNYREWDAAELGLSTQAAKVSRGQADMVGIPVFTSRTLPSGTWARSNRCRARWQRWRSRSKSMTPVR